MNGCVVLASLVYAYVCKCATSELALDDSVLQLEVSQLRGSRALPQSISVGASELSELTANQTDAEPC